MSRAGNGSENQLRARKPPWLRATPVPGRSANLVRRVLAAYRLETVCEQARCPNRGHCYGRGTATFMIMGTVCTRACTYCAVEHQANGDEPPGLPPLDPDEPSRIAGAARELGLEHVVVTSVTRDDLPDGGARHFASTAASIRRELPDATIELLVPDFKGKASSIELLASSPLDVLNHNIETVPSLFPSVRPGASFEVSLGLLSSFCGLRPDIPLKSGMMLGMGEAREEVMTSLSRLFDAGVRILTLGQYLQPSSRHRPVSRYVHPDEFTSIRLAAMGMGFDAVEAGPLVRSSFHADMTMRLLSRRT
ncbi:lipoyl synthase [Candidatus Fermentibacterales bacterium]|nr:lipoyl synthase [Candidatus Fermentibacterales bacterium]